MEKINCPKCDRKWETPSEQQVAITKRGKCMACIVQDKETFDMNPYEFDVNA